MMSFLTDSRGLAVPGLVLLLGVTSTTGLVPIKCRTYTEKNCCDPDSTVGQSVINRVRFFTPRKYFFGGAAYYYVGAYTQMYKCPEVCDGRLNHRVRATPVDEKKVTVTGRDREGLCPDSHVVTGITSSRHWFDSSDDTEEQNSLYSLKMELDCAKPQEFGVEWVEFYKTGWFANGSADCSRDEEGTAYVMVGLDCHDNQCIYKRLVCAQVDVARMNYRRGVEVRWDEACSGPATTTCSKEFARSITRTKSTTWGLSFTRSVEASLCAKTSFLGFGEVEIGIKLEWSVTSSVEFMASQSRNWAEKCSFSTRGLPDGYGTAIKVWQWTTRVFEDDEQSSEVKMPVCAFWVTPDTMYMRCPKNQCAEPFCQYCILKCAPIDAAPGQVGFCRKNCKCPPRGGHCKSDEECDSNLVCCENVGCHYGYEDDNTAVCLESGDCEVWKKYPCGSSTMGLKVEF